MHDVPSEHWRPSSQVSLPSSTLLPHCTRRKHVDVLYPDRLVPGNTIEWYADGDPSDGLTDLVYSHEAVADGTADDTYFNAGGRFWLKVPIAGIDSTFAEKTAKVELSIGETGVTLVGCSEFGVPEYTADENWWIYNEHDEDDED